MAENNSRGILGIARSATSVQDCCAHVLNYIRHGCRRGRAHINEVRSGAVGRPAPSLPPIPSREFPVFQSAPDRALLFSSARIPCSVREGLLCRIAKTWRVHGTKNQRESSAFFRCRTVGVDIDSERVGCAQGDPSTERAIRGRFFFLGPKHIFFSADRESPPASLVLAISWRLAGHDSRGHNTRAR